MVRGDTDVVANEVVVALSLTCRFEVKTARLTLLGEADPRTATCADAENAVEVTVAVTVETASPVVDSVTKQVPSAPVVQAAPLRAPTPVAVNETGAPDTVAWVLSRTVAVSLAKLADASAATLSLTLTIEPAT
jgi:hypothetical protein